MKNAERAAAAGWPAFEVRMVGALEKALKIGVLAQDAGRHREAVEVRSVERLLPVRALERFEGAGEIVALVRLAAARERVRQALGRESWRFIGPSVFRARLSLASVRGGESRGEGAGAALREVTPRDDRIRPPRLNPRLAAAPS
jgi:hypothetical protein